MKSALRFLRRRLHARAYELNRNHPEAAQALWVIVDELDALLVKLNRKEGK